MSELSLFALNDGGIGSTEIFSRVADGVADNKNINLFQRGRNPLLQSYQFLTNIFGSLLAFPGFDIQCCRKTDGINRMLGKSQKGLETEFASNLFAIVESPFRT